jgi:hypothetical protein
MIIQQKLKYENFTPGLMRMLLQVLERYSDSTGQILDLILYYSSLAINEK